MFALGFRRNLGSGLVIGIASVLALGPAGAASAAAPDRLAAGQGIGGGGSIGAGDSSLAMGGDGDVVLRVTLDVVLWTSGTTGFPGARLVMLPSGELAVFDPGGSRRWSSGTAGRGPATVVMQRDGNLVIYSGTRAVWSSRTYKQAYAIGRFPLYGWSQVQWQCLNQLWRHESGWNERAGNPRTGAYGIPQAYPAAKMAAAGADYLTNPRTQIHWGEDYISARYGTPCAAWAFELARGWY